MLSVLRRAPVVVLCLVLVGTPTVLAQAPAKGTEILWDRYGVPHIFAPDHASLFYAYGYAQMEAHSELLLRLYAQARGRGAEYYGANYLAADRWVRTNGIPETARKWAAGQSVGVWSADRVVRARVERLGGRAQGRAQCRGAAGAAGQRRRRLRALPARHSLRLDHQSGEAVDATRARRRRDARLQRVGHRRVPLGDGQGDPDEQLAPPVGRHPHLLRGAALGARRHVVRRGVGRLPRAASVLHRVRRLDADDEQSCRVGSVSPGAEGRRLRARRTGEAIRDAHRNHQGTGSERIAS